MKDFFVAVIVLVAISGICSAVNYFRDTTLRLNGKPYDEVVEELGHPHKSSGSPMYGTGRCQWVLIGDKKRFKTGMPSSEEPYCGGIWAIFNNGRVTDWGGTLNGEQIKKEGRK